MSGILLEIVSYLFSISGLFLCKTVSGGRLPLKC